MEVISKAANKMQKAIVLKRPTFIRGCREVNKANVDSSIRYRSCKRKDCLHKIHMKVSLFICSITGTLVEEMNLRYLCTIMGIFLLLAATAAAGSFKAEMDVDSYVDANNANQSFAIAIYSGPHLRTTSPKPWST